MLNYKYKLSGIKMITINEAYTSKCSFIVIKESNVDCLNQNMETS